MKKKSVNNLNPFGFELKLVKLSDIMPHPKNPRKTSAREAKDIAASVNKFGLIDKPILNITPEGDFKYLTIAGHKRIEYLLELGETHVECQVPKIALSSEEVEELLIRHNKNTGSWDFDLLKAFNPDNLQSWGFKASELNFGEDMMRKEDDPIYPLAPRMSERYEYVVIFTTDEIQRANLETILGLEKMQDYKSGRAGLGRVISYEKFKKAIGR